MTEKRRAFIVPTTASGGNAGAMVVGTTTSNALRWGAVTPSDSYLTATDSATLGALFTLNAPGIWHVQLELLCVAGASLIAGLALGAAPAAGSLLPFGVAGVVARGQVTCAALTTSSVFVSRTIRLTDAAIGQVLTTCAADAAGATPVPSISATAGFNWFAITRGNDAG